MTEGDLWDWMMEGNYPSAREGESDLDSMNRRESRRAFATLARDCVFKRWQGHDAKPEFIENAIPAGTKVKVVMASRFGDVGITDDLAADNGYHYRVICIDGDWQGRPMIAENLLTNIEKIS